VAIEGQLRDVGLADIAQLLAMGRKTGCLTVTDRANFGYIYFRDGRVIYATVLNRPDRLGELLVRNQVITRKDLSQAMEQQAHQPGKRLGQLLIAQGSLTEEALNRFISLQIEEAVYHLFTWEEGSFHFDPEQRPDEDPSLLASINTESLLLEGARRTDEFTLIRNRIHSTTLIFAPEPALHLRFGDGSIERTPTLAKVIPLLDGMRTVEEIIDESGLVEFEVAKALHLLMERGLLREVGERTPEPIGESEAVQQHRSLGEAFYRAGMLEESEREYRGLLASVPKDHAVRSRLALIELRSGRFEEGLAEIDAIPVEERATLPILRNRAVALELLGRYREALEEVNQAIELWPGEGESLLQRAVLLFKSHEPRAALQSFRRYRGMLAEGVDPPARYFAYAVLAAATAGELDEALQLGREGLALYPAHGAILVNLGIVLERRGETDAAEALYLRAVGETPPPPQAHKNLGDLAYRRGDFAGARAHYERAVRLDPLLGDDSYLKLGNLAYKEGEQELAIQFWRKALGINPANEVVRTNLELISAAPRR